MTLPVSRSGHIRRVAARLLWATGLPALACRRQATSGRFALLLHGVSSHRVPGIDRLAQPHLTVEELSDLLDWLRHRFAFLTPGEFLAGHRPGVLMTFDDGFANNLHNALPVLRSFDCPAIFFVSTQHVVAPRDWLTFVRQRAEQTWGGISNVPEKIARDWYDGLSAEELRTCAVDPLITIGSHGVTHKVLPECTDAELKHELLESRSLLQELTGGEVEYLAYPRGKYDARVLHETQAAGYTRAFTIDSIGLGMDPFELPRIGIYEADGCYISLKLSGLHRRPLPVTDH